MMCLELDTRIFGTPFLVRHFWYAIFGTAAAVCVGAASGGPNPTLLPHRRHHVPHMNSATCNIC